MPHILEVDGVFLTFGLKKVLQRVYLKAETGKVTGLLGRNGTGKSSLLKVIYGELGRAEKSVRIDGKAILSSRRRPQDMRLLPHKSMVPKNLRVKDVFADFEVDIEGFLQRFQGFKPYQDHKFGTLSTGSGRIVELYVLLKAETKFCLLDEPFAGMSPLHIDTFSELISEEKQKKSIVLTDHHYKSVLNLSDRLYLLRNGAALAVNDATDLVKLGYLSCLD